MMRTPFVPRLGSPEPDSLAPVLVVSREPWMLGVTAQPTAEWERMRSSWPCLLALGSCQRRHSGGGGTRMGRG